MLHIVNKSPHERPALDACLRIAGSGAILLTEDAVYAATRGTAVEARIRAAMARFEIYVLLPDAEARAVADRLIDGIKPVDHGGFVDLVAAHKNCQSWL
ncbi:MAG: sulfurtransferase complex subunit TusB [Betaproteobacteria bacterium]